MRLRNSWITTSRPTEFATVVLTTRFMLVSCQTTWARAGGRVAHVLFAMVDAQLLVKEVQFYAINGRSD